MINPSMVMFGFLMGIIFYRYSRKARSLIGPFTVVVTGILGIAFHNLVALRSQFMTAGMAIGYAVVPLAVYVAILGFKERKSRNLAAAFEVISAIMSLQFAPILIFAYFA